MNIDSENLLYYGNLLQKYRSQMIAVYDSYMLNWTVYFPAFHRDIEKKIDKESS